LCRLSRMALLSAHDEWFDNSFRFQGHSPLGLPQNISRLHQDLTVVHSIICPLFLHLTKISHSYTFPFPSVSQLIYLSPLLFAGFSTRSRQDSSSRKEFEGFILTYD
jgi:hypothetical protein